MKKTNKWQLFLNKVQVNNLPRGSYTISATITTTALPFRGKHWDEVVTWNQERGIQGSDSDAYE